MCTTAFIPYNSFEAILGESIWIGTLIFFCVFCIGSAMAVYFFVSNLSKLAHAREQTLEKMNMTEEDIRLDKFQLRLIHLAARYLLLYGIASLSSILLTVAAIFILGRTIVDIFVSIDFCINLICMYLQFGFAQEHYRGCCGCFDRMCRRSISDKTKRSIHQLSVDRMRSLSESRVDSAVSATSSPSPRSTSETGGLKKSEDQDL